MVLRYHSKRYRTNLSRQPGQGGDADDQKRDLRAELLKAEAAHFAKTKGIKEEPSSPAEAPKRRLEGPSEEGGVEDEDPEAKRRRILEETRDIDADSDGESDDSSSEEDSDDEEDETAELMRELEKIKKERAEQKEKEVSAAGNFSRPDFAADKETRSERGPLKNRRSGRLISLEGIHY
jgi:hypothetical protein